MTLTVPDTPYGSPTDAPVFKLHSLTGIIIATVLGGPIAGCVILAINYARVGMRRHAGLSILGGVLSTALLLFIAWIIPDSWHVPNAAFFMPQLFGMMSLSKYLQGNLVAEHLSAGGRLVSKWIDAGIGALSCVVLLAIVVGLVFATTGPTGTRVAVGTSEVYYSGSATEDDAKSMMNDLRQSGFLSEDHAVTIGLSRGSGGFEVSFVVAAEALQSDETSDGFRIVGRDLATGHLGKPLTIWLCDDAMDKKKKIVIE
jgi:hypothetical protein